jgi:hypothetical protein
MNIIYREDVIEEIADALAFGDLGTRSTGFSIDRRADGSLVLDYQEAEDIFVVTVVRRKRA